VLRLAAIVALIAVGCTVLAVSLAPESTVLGYVKDIVAGAAFGFAGVLIVRAFKRRGRR
jgi:Na+-translocating ferredoxin:NAD+ oxidoreductase RnfA subunit